LLIYIQGPSEGGTIPTDTEWFWQDDWNGTPIAWVDSEIFADLIVYETSDWMFGEHGWRRDHPLQGTFITQ